jgi:dehydrogenase/reductase SDR family protein 7B
MTKRRFDGQVVWITGASSGIGEALAQAFAQEGAALVLSARRKPELDRVAALCTPLGAASVDVIPLDLSDVDGLAAKTDEVIRRVGNVSVMVHNAGVSQRALALETSLDVDRRLMDINYFGVIAITKALLPHMLRVKGGRFVVVSSVMGLFGAKLRTAYSASKHALHGFFESLESEHHNDGIRITMVCPGYVRTNISKNALRGDGTAHAIMDEATDHGLTPERVASEILDAIAKDRSMITPAGKERVGVYLKRFAPGLLARILRDAKST